MDNNIDNKKLNQVLRITSKILKKLYILVILILIYVAILILNKLNTFIYLCNIIKILSPLFIGIVIAWLLRPIVKYLTKNKNNKIFVVIVIYIILLFLIYLILSIFIPIFIKQTNEFISMAPKLLDNGTDMIAKTFSNLKINLSTIKKEIFNIINKFAIDTSKDIPITLVNLFKSIGTFFIGLIIGFYLLITDTSYIEDILNKYLKKDTYELLIKVNIILRNYVRGILLSSLLIFILSTMVFYICGLKGALLFGIICGITDVIPFIGPYIGAFIPVIVAFTKNISIGILVSVMILIVQTIEANIIHPLIMSKSIKVHPVTVMVSLLIFGYFFGIIGMMIATPIVAILKELYFYFIKRYNSYKRKLVR